MLHGVSSVGDYAFNSCSSLNSVTIPDTVTNIGSFAFAFCTSVTHIVIPPSVTAIGAQAFQNCVGLTSITIPSAVTYIGTYAFVSCSNLLGVYFQGNAPMPTNDPSVFLGNTNAIAYYLPRTVGWGATFDGIPTKLWNPQAQTGDGFFGVQNNQFGFNIAGSSNLVIVVEASTNLANWLSVSTNTLNIYVGTNGTSYFSDPDWTNHPTRFYRIRSP
jgi:hypothetical protein